MGIGLFITFEETGVRGISIGAGATKRAEKLGIAVEDEEFPNFEGLAWVDKRAAVKDSPSFGVCDIEGFGLFSEGVWNGVIATWSQTHTQRERWSISSTTVVLLVEGELSINSLNYQPANTIVINTSHQHSINTNTSTYTWTHEHITISTHQHINNQPQHIST